MPENSGDENRADEMVIIELDQRLEFGIASIDTDLDAQANETCTNTSCSGSTNGTCGGTNASCSNGTCK